MFFWSKNSDKREKIEQRELECKPKEEFDNPDLLIAFFKDETGVTFEKQRSIVIKKLAIFCRLHNIYSFKECYEKLKKDSTLKQELINNLTTNESYFYREFAQIQSLVREASKKSKPISILCAPCSTGEEPYSIALALLESGFKDGEFKIVGIDINTQALQKAKERKYSQRSVKNIPPSTLEKYFKKVDDIYLLDEKVMRFVELKQINIFEDSFKNLGKFDFVLSRNMLIYFDKETKQKAKTILESMRKDDTTSVFFGHADLF